MADYETIRDARADLIRANMHFIILFDHMDNAVVETLEDVSTGDLEVPETAESAGTLEKKAGVSLIHDMDSTEVEAYGEGDPVRTIISKRKISFEAEFLETNRVVLERFWATYFTEGSNLDTSAHGGVVIKAPTLPRNLYYRAYLVASDDVNGEDLYAYYILPKVQLSKVDNQDSKDDAPVTYKMTFTAFRDKAAGFTVAQGWCGPGWRRLVDQTGFVAETTGINMLPATATLSVAGTQQLTVTGVPNGINRTPDCTFVSATPAKATVDADGLVTAVAAGSSVITATYRNSLGTFTDTTTITVS